MGNKTDQPEARLSKERGFLLAILIAIVGYIFIAAPDAQATCTQNLRNATNMTAAEIQDICEHAP